MRSLSRMGISNSLNNMGKIITRKINRFDGGMANDIRSKDPYKARLIKNLDAFSFPNKIVPRRDSESGNDTSSRKIYDFAYLDTLGLVGVGTSSNLATIFYKNTYTDATWNQTANNQSDIAENKRDDGFLVYYATKGRFYLPTGSTTIGGYDPTGAGAWTDQTLGDLTYGSRGLVHSKDDNLYVSYRNKIARYDGTTWTTTALTLPLRYVITSLCEYGNYLAIGCRTSDSFGDRSRVFLWDRDSSVTTLSESIDWGYGKLAYIEEYKGHIIGASYQDSSVFGSNRIGPERISIKAYSGSQADTLIELIGDESIYPATVSGQLYGRGFQKTNDRLYFLAGIEIDGSVNNGLWSIGRNGNNPLAIQLEYLPNNDTAVTSMEGFYVVGSFAFISYDGAGAMSKTTESRSFTATSIYETLKDDLEDASITKKLVGVSVMTKALGSGAQVVIKYKADSDSSWTTIMTHSTVNSLTKSAINIESTSAVLPQFKEIQFRLESTGGAEILGLTFDAEIISNRAY